MTSPHRQFHRIAWIAVALALVVIVFGAFVRLSNAGLSCPDWPTCYGRAAWPVHAHEIAQANESFERPVETHKAWREQFHRHLAAILGLLVLGLAALAARQRKYGLGLVLGASAIVAVSIPLYVQQRYGLSAALVGLAEAMLLGAAWRWTNSDFARVATLTLAVIIFQAMLGMWTVTWLLKPVVVMAHLLGGLTTFSLLVWLAARASPNAGLPVSGAIRRRLRPLLLSGVALVAVQIALGGWVSANYAALACGTEFPTCLGQWWPETDFAQGFVLWRGIGVDYEGGVLDGPARAAIHLSHRLFAIVVAGHLLALGLRLRSLPEVSGWGSTLLTLLGLQLLLGVMNVVSGLPLAVATAHNAGAALLLFTLVLLLARLGHAANADAIRDPVAPGREDTSVVRPHASSSRTTATSVPPL
jgi:cytochrome c oxidase assembly protein subunit 15